MKADRKSIPVINPASEEVIGEIPRGNAEDADRAVRAAREAFLKWRWVSGIEKAAILHQVAAGIRSKQQDLAIMMTREGGKPFCENRDEVEWTAACFDYYAEVGRNSRGASLPPVFQHQVNFTIKEPYGVVAAIIPWNYPLLLLSWKVAPALAAGNTVCTGAKRSGLTIRSPTTMPVPSVECVKRAIPVNWVKKDWTNFEKRNTFIWTTNRKSSRIGTRIRNTTDNRHEDKTSDQGL